MSTVRSPKHVDLELVEDQTRFNHLTGTEEEVYSVSIREIIESFIATLEVHGFEFLSRERNGGGGPHKEDCIWLSKGGGSVQDLIDQMRLRRPYGRSDDR